jgi:hypothetical protein
MVSPTVKSCGPDQISTLRHLFKARCAETQQLHQNWQIQVHRALSWLERASETDPVDQPDGRLLYGWIASIPSMVAGTKKQASLLRILVPGATFSALSSSKIPGVRSAGGWNSCVAKFFSCSKTSSSNPYSGGFHSSQAICDARITKRFQSSLSAAGGAWRHWRSSGSMCCAFNSFMVRVEPPHIAAGPGIAGRIAATDLGGG